MKKTLCIITALVLLCSICLTAYGNESDSLSSDVKIGDIVTFGTYEQDNDLTNGKEAIEWIILDTNQDQVYVVSRYVLDGQCINEEYVDINWDNCSLRSWLNSDFINEAFTPAEQENIIATMAGADPAGDKILLLTPSEVETYSASVDVINAEWTNYAQEAANISYWWLRPTETMLKADYVMNGKIGRDSFYLMGHSLIGGVRPSMWVKIQNLNAAGEMTEEASEMTEAASDDSPSKQYVTAIDGTINIRMSPDHDSALLTSVSAGVLLEYLNETGEGYGSDGLLHEWMKVETDAGTGWVRSDLVKFTEDASSAGNGTVQSTESQIATLEQGVTVTGDDIKDMEPYRNPAYEDAAWDNAGISRAYFLLDDSLNLRSAPDHSSDLVCSLTDQESQYLFFEGEAETGYGSDGQLHVWFKVRLNDGTEGWARNDLMNFNYYEFFSQGIDISEREEISSVITSVAFVNGKKIVMDQVSLGLDQANLLYPKYAVITCYDGDTPVWQYTSETIYPLNDDYLLHGVTENYIYFSNHDVLYALDVQTGEIAWANTDAGEFFGSDAGANAYVGEYGELYLTERANGAFMAVDEDGNTLCFDYTPTGTGGYYILNVEYNDGYAEVSCYSDSYGNYKNYTVQMKE